MTAAIRLFLLIEILIFLKSTTRTVLAVLFAIGTTVLKLKIIFYFSVCPIPDCIKMVDRTVAYNVKRGIPPKDSLQNTMTNERLILSTN